MAPDRGRNARSSHGLRKVSGRPPASGKRSSGSVNPFQKFIRRIYRRIRQAFRGVNSRMAAGVAGLAVVIICVAILAAILTSKNAYEVYLDTTKISVIKKSDDVTMESLKEEAVALREDQEGAKIEVNESIMLVPVHASSKDMASRSYIVSELSKKFTCKVEAGVIYVEGIEMCIVSSTAVANEIKNNIIAPYVEEGLNIIQKDIVENFQVQTRFVEKSEIISSDTAYTLLTAKRDTEQFYTVVANDSAWSIATSNGMTLEELRELNPVLYEEPVLKVGQQLVLMLPTPLLSVITVEEAEFTEVAEAGTKTQQNPNESRAYSRVVQQGRDGQKVVTYHITRVNGAVQSREPVNTEYLVEPVDEIVEVGTR